MHFFNHYNYNIVKYDLINKFRYKAIKKIPKITSAVLRFRLKHNDMKYLIAALAALELITSQKGVLIKSKVPNVTLKLRKGQPIGCKVTIRKNTLFSFITNLYSNISTKKKNVKKKADFKNKTISFKIQNVLLFSHLESNYQFFKNLSRFDISLMTTANDFDDYVYLLKAYKLNV